MGGASPLGWGGGYDMAGLLDFDISGILMFCMQMNLKLEDQPQDRSSHLQPLLELSLVSGGLHLQLRGLSPWEVLFLWRARWNNRHLTFFL